MAAHAELTLQTGLSVFFCDPHSPWQRGTNENTNGLLRQYFPKGTDLSRYKPNQLAAVAHTLNARPRRVLRWHPHRSAPECAIFASLNQRCDDRLNPPCEPASE
jgi:IS30 family transposase